MLYPVDVSFVTQKYIDSLIASKDENVQGCYTSENNTIYVVKDLTTTTKLHILYHELYHAFEDQTERMDEEGRADSFAALLLRLFPETNIEHVLKVKERNGKG